ncbi:hypothetical protein PanWU01x14_116770, partial [Parasponia andersonii]
SSSSLFCLVEKNRNTIFPEITSGKQQRQTSLSILSSVYSLYFLRGHGPLMPPKELKLLEKSRSGWPTCFSRESLRGLTIAVPMCLSCVSWKGTETPSVQAKVNQSLSTATDANT